VYRVQELPHIGVYGFCPETKNGFEFLGCYYSNHTSQTYSDVIKMCGDTLAERYELTMERIEQIRREAYLVEVLWECEFMGKY